MARLRNTAARRGRTRSRRRTIPTPDELVLELLAIPGSSGDEAAVALAIRTHLLAAGASASQITSDRAHRRTPLRGNEGNLALRLPGTRRGARRMLMAHMDTVPICAGCQPQRHGHTVRATTPGGRLGRTGLGADDRAGVAVVLHAALRILSQEVPHPPLTFLWTIQEEVGLQGSRLVRLGMLGKPRLAFNWDGGASDKLTIGATGGYRMEIDIRGLASHAGNAPERGISAVAIASLAIANLEADGWHGSVRQGDQRGTSNIGVIAGGTATNVVTDRVQIMAEARSHDPHFREQIVRRIERAFVDAAAQLPNHRGRTGTVKFSGRLDYESFRLPTDSPCVRSAQAAVRACGGEPLLAITNGGLDANWMTARGIPTVSLGCGQRDQHTTQESLDLRQFRQACQIALTLATATEEHGAAGA